MKNYAFILILLISIPLVVAQDQCALVLSNSKEVDVNCNANPPDNAKPILHYTNRCSFDELIDCDRREEVDIIANEFLSFQCSGEQLTACFVNYYSQ